MSKLQNLARNRNWAKARLKGIIAYNRDVFTPEENAKLKEIGAIRDKMMTSWDRNSRKLGITPAKKK